MSLGLLLALSAMPLAALVGIIIVAIGAAIADPATWRDEP